MWKTVFFFEKAEHPKFSKGYSQLSVNEPPFEGRHWVLDKGVPPPSDYPESCWQLQTACFRSHAELQTPALDQKTRLDERYLVIGGPGDQKREVNPSMTPTPVYVKMLFYSLVEALHPRHC